MLYREYGALCRLGGCAGIEGNIRIGQGFCDVYNFGNYFIRI